MILKDLTKYSLDSHLENEYTCLLPSLELEELTIFFTCFNRRKLFISFYSVTKKEFFVKLDY